MKKSKILIRMILILFLFGMITDARIKEKIQSVLNEEEKRIYYLNSNQENITNITLDKIKNNFNIEFIRIYPKNKLAIEEDKIQTELEKFSYYAPESFIKRYREVLKKYGLFDDLEKIEIHGIPIKGIVVFCSKEEIQLLKNQYPKLIIVATEEELKK